MKISKNFDLREVVSPGDLRRYGDRSAQFIDFTIIHAIQFIRDYFDAAVIVNDWHYSKRRYPHIYRGLRPPASTIGAWRSQHKRGAALDFNVRGLTPRQVYDEILQNQITFLLAGVRAIEDVNFTPSWNHIDCRFTGSDNEILIIKP